MKAVYVIVIAMSILLFGLGKLKAQIGVPQTIACYSVDDDRSCFVKQHDGLFQATMLQLGTLTFNVHFESVECDGPDIVIKGLVHCGAYWDSTGNDVYALCDRSVPVYYCTLQKGTNGSMDLTLFKREELVVVAANDGTFNIRLKPEKNAWLVFYFDNEISHAYELTPKGE